MTPRVRVRIDRLVLEGVAISDRRAVIRAFEAELGRLLVADMPGASRHLPGTSVSVVAPSDASAAGRTAAGAVAQAIGGGPR